ncbi:MAG TPA: 3-dehydroquinate synthase [Nitrospiraceae bacterium]
MRKIPEQIVAVALGDRSYDIAIQPGLLTEVGERLTNLAQSRQVGVVTDRHVARHHLPAMLRSLRSAGFDPTDIVLAPGERTKTLSTVGAILDVLVKKKFERKSLLVALGGGVVGDLTGFAAAIYQRGIPFVQVPTTLVAQVDSSVGGKTGVDHPLGKNLFGAFHQPRAVFVDPVTLQTLPHREWVAGIAEVIKYGVIADEAFFSFLEQSIGSLLQLDELTVLRVIARSCEIKAQVVADDERESDRRRILNYGHTIGHALESLEGYRRMIHGEAVGIGLVQEADLAHHLGICEREVVERIRNLVGCAGLAEAMPSVSFQSLWAAMQHDKKVVGGQVVGVWPVRIGEVVIRPLDQRACEDWYHSRQGRTSRLEPHRRSTRRRSGIRNRKRR